MLILSKDKNQIVVKIAIIVATFLIPLPVNAVNNTLLQPVSVSSSNLTVSIPDDGINYLVGQDGLVFYNGRFISREFQLRETDFDILRDNRILKANTDLLFYLQEQ